MSSFKNDFLKLQRCKIKGDDCSYPAPTRTEIAEMANQLDLPVNLLSKIFNNISSRSLKGGAAAESPSSSSSEEDEEDESLFVSESGLSQGQQDNIVNNIMLAVSAFITLGGLTATAYNLSAIEQYLYNNGILEPLCKGVLDRAMRV